EGDRIFAAEATRDPKKVLRGRLEALGPVFDDGSLDDPLYRELEADGAVLRTRIDGRPAWCDRRLLARIQRHTLDPLRREIEPVTASPFLPLPRRRQHLELPHPLARPPGAAAGVRPP